MKVYPLMKEHSTLSVLMVLIVLSISYGCSPKMLQQPYSAQVNFLNKDEAGSITLNSRGFGKDENAAIVSAQTNAFNIILFKGIPGTDLNVPLIEREDEARATNGEYFDRLFSQGYYHNFLMSSSLHGDPVKVKGGVNSSVDLTINYNALRKDLEQHNIIRKFGL
jgi:hypothetical protein